MKAVKVSIITPCLNSEKTIRQTIESVLNQTYPHIEYIIVDGGSSDGTISIIKEYVPLFKGRLKYVSEKDHGIYDAMNKGIKMSAGQLIGIINSDDYYEYFTVEKVVSQYTPNKEQIIYGHLRNLKNDRVFGINKNSHKNLRNEMIPHPTCFASRNIYSKYGLFLDKLKIAADYELMLRVAKNKVRFVQIPEVLADFRTGGASVDRRTQLEKNTIRFWYRELSGREYILFLVKYIFKSGYE